MSHPTVADRLRAARLSGFVGRAAELDLFRDALASDPPEFSVLFVHGPGGVGKSALLEMFGELAARAGRQVLRLDARSLELTPPGIRSAVGAPRSGTVVLLDGYELMEPLDGWLRETLLPSLPADVLFVVAGRNAPAAAWRTEPGWSALVRVLSLRNLRPTESRRFLTARGVPDAQRESVIAFTHGHPLALTLVADTIRDEHEPFRPEDEPDVVRALVQRFVAQVPDPRHRDALEACAHLRTTTEERLAEAIGDDEVADLFDWLRGLSFVEQTAQGIVPHDLARDVLDTDLRWRNVERYARLHRRIRAGVVARIRSTTGVPQQQALFDLLHLHRNNPVMGMFHSWESMGTAYAEPAVEADVPDILEMVERHEGAESAALAKHWHARQPGAFVAYRTLGGELIGFSATLELHAAADEDIQADPATRIAVEFVRRFGPLRTGDELLYGRFTMGRDTHHEVSTAMDLTALTSSRDWLTRPRLAWNLIAVDNPDLFDPVFGNINQHRSPEADFEVDSHRYSVYAHDWRAEPAAEWLEAMSEREIATYREAAGVVVAAPAPLVVLSEPEFVAEVRRALRDFTRPEALATNPLLRSRAVVERGGRDAGAGALQELLREAVESLRANVRDERFYRAVDRTFLRPAGTRERAAELLDLPFSTYRAHLTTGVERITAWLWRRELHGGEI